MSLPNPMTFTLDHWRNPRKTIATRYEKDDLGYVTHGAMMALQAIRILDLKPSEASGMSVLDYGCGTGRVTRVLAGYFGEVVGYDPVVECIQTGVEEQRGMPFKNLIMTSMFEAVQGSKFDIVTSVSVMEHLSPEAQETMLDNIQSVAKPGARLVLWYSMRQNGAALAKRFGDHIVAEDTAFLAANPNSAIQVREFRL